MDLDQFKKHLIVMIFNENCDEKSGITKDGKPYLIRTQEAFAYTGQRFPIRFSLVLEETQDPYPEGNYYVDHSSFYVSDYNRLVLGRIKLVEIPEEEPFLKG